MSLHIYFEGVDSLPSLPVKRDADTFFMRVHLDGCAYDSKIIESIERGKYLSNDSFIDRFGNKLLRECLSTGTKIALSLYHAPDVVIWGVEMGRNALADVVRLCDRGHLLLEASNFYVSDDIDDTVIDIICKGRHYTSLHEFSTYMMKDAPYGD